MKNKLKWLIPVLILVLLTAAAVIYVEDYYHAFPEAEKALKSQNSVRVEKTGFGWFFDGPSDEYALIFYPGGKVEETAYAPLMQKLAANGVDAFLVKMPLRLAVFGTNRADTVMREYHYPHWYIAGHSLGGVCAASYASQNNGSVEGLVLLASYPTKELDKSLRVVFIYGSEDRVLNIEKYKQSKNLAPANSEEYVIAGGNHAQFGTYGIQRGDGPALIPAEEQLSQTVDKIIKGIPFHN